MPPEPPSPASSTSADALPPPLAIVALDDDPDFRQYLAHVLTPDGHALRLAATGAEFFALCEQSLPEVVLLDMKMGRDSGEAVLEEIRRRWPRLCVIVVTGYPSLDSMRQTLKRWGGGGGEGGGWGVSDYLAKPFSIADLRRSLAQAAAAHGLGYGGRPQDKLRHELGRAIRLARTQREWTLKDLSETSGISVSQLSSIERGSHTPSLESLLDIAAALEARPSAWFAGAGF